jgi:hypothetical protein
MTIDAGQTRDEIFAIAPNAPFFLYNQMTPEIIEQVENIDGEKFMIGDKAYDEELKNTYKTKISEFNVNSCPKEFEPLVTKVINAYSECNAWDGLSCYPPRIINPTEDAKTTTFVLIDILRSIKPQKAFELIKWISVNMVPENVKSFSSFKSSFIKACCLCHRKRKMFKDDTIFWAVLDVHNHFTLYNTTGDQLTVHMEADIGSIRLSHSGKTVKLFDKTGVRVKRIIPLEPSQNELWAKVMNLSTLPKLPLFFTSSISPIPDLLLFAINEALLSPDQVVVRALTHFQVSKVSRSVDLAEALFDIFAYAGKVNDLITVMAANEFSAPELSENTVLRGNSHLTNMFKIFFKRFGMKYYESFLKRIVLYIDSKGDLDLKKPAEVNSQKAQTMVFTVLNRISGSLEHVPQEIRHFASVLKQAASIRFNKKQATYNTLSGFFYLRFVSSILSNPLETDPNLELKNQWLKVMVPAAQLLMTPFNLIQMSGKYDVFTSWNKTLSKKIFPKLIDFVFSVAVCEEAPVYTPPSKERLREALQVVWNKIGESNGEFVNMYVKLAKDLPCTSLGANFANFLTGYFNQNI